MTVVLLSEVQHPQRNCASHVPKYPTLSLAGSDFVVQPPMRQPAISHCPQDNEPMLGLGGILQGFELVPFW